jgi:hypothetical protein
MLQFMNTDSRTNIYTEKKKSKTIYDCDLASNNANSYELWMKRRREIKINEDPYLTPK